MTMEQKGESMDLIERQDAIDAVHKEFDDCLVWDESGKTTANAVEEILDDVPSAKPEWIPCSERLPIGSDVVLLSLPPSIDANGDELVEGVICGHYIGGKNELWGISDGSTFGYGLVSTRYGTNPTHWMPLPEPYREE